MTDPTDIFQWRRVGARLTTSGQPSEAQIAAIARLGVTDVVNLALHTHDKALADEPGCVRNAGMRYHHIPVAFDDPAPADYDAFCTTMVGLEGARVHVHCIANLRVSAFLYRYQRDVLGIAEPDARAVMEALWKPGGVWARFIDDDAAEDLPHRYAGQDY